MHVTTCTIDTNITGEKPMPVKLTLVQHSLGHLYYILNVMSIEGEVQKIDIQGNQVEALYELLGIFMHGARHGEVTDKSAPIPSIIRGLFNG